MSLITAKNVSVIHDGRTVLRDMDFTLNTAEIVTIVGPNGSGKSSFMKVLIGIDAASSGQISRSDELRVGYLPQKLTLDPTFPMTVARLLQLQSGYTHQTADAACKKVGLGDIQQSQLSDLSGGELQRVLLARALLSNPNVLALDEPSQGLDQAGTAALYQLIEDIRRDIGCAVLIISHDLHVVMSTSDRVLCLNGHICCEGTPTVVSNAPEYRALFGDGTAGALALYRHEHDHSHGPGCDHG